MMTSPGASPRASKGAWRTLQSYIFWQHERGTLHYDIMVTIILLFLFTSPYWINFNDKPVPRALHQTDVLVTPDGHGGLLYEISANAISNGGDQSVKDQLLHIIEPISGAVSITKFEGITDSKGKLQTYRVWVNRE